MLGEPSKLKSADPGRGSWKIQKVPKFQLGKVKKEEGGVITFQKTPKFPKNPKFEKECIISIS